RPASVRANRRRGSSPSSIGRYEPDRNPPTCDLRHITPAHDRLRFLHRWPEPPADLGGSSCRTTARSPHPTPWLPSRPRSKTHRGRSPIARIAAGSSSGPGATSKTDCDAFRSSASPGGEPLDTETVTLRDTGQRLQEEIHGD